MKNFNPYLFDALYMWISESGETPYILVDCSVEGVSVPKDFIKNNLITLNVSLSAIKHYEVKNEILRFETAFNGIKMQIKIPIDAILQVFLAKVVWEWL